MVKKAAKVIGNIITVFIILIIAMSLYSMLQYRKNPDKIPSVFGFSSMSVLTGSMRPYLEPGDMIVDKAVKAELVKVGDVLTYRESGAIVTHRVVEVLEEEGKLLFRTRGDANNVEDGYMVNQDQIIGKVILRIPYGGYVARFIRSPIGILILIAIPIVPMLIGELKKVALSGGEKKDVEEAKSEDSVHID